ncbi:MAG: EAL domain-containing protein [Bryobacteraceae bacterium]
MRQSAAVRSIKRNFWTSSRDPELWGSDDLFRDLVENAHDLIYSIDLEGNFTCVNRAALRLTGYVRYEALEMNIAHLVAPEDLDKARQMIQRTLRGELSDAYDLRILSKDGRRIVVEVTHRLVLKNGVPIGTHSIARDITERRRGEMLEQDRMRVLEMIARREPIDEVLRQLAAMVERQHPELMACLMLARDSRLYVAAAPNLPEEFVRSMDGVWAGRTMGSCASAAYWRKPIFAHDIATDANWTDQRATALKHELRSAWSMPILTGRGDLVGTLAVYQRRPAKPEPHHLRLLQMTTGSAALAIEHRRLTEELAFQAHHDALTGLPNRKLLHERLQQAIVAARRTLTHIALLYIDLDQFKLVNDTMGHPAGDRLLQQTACRLTQCTRESDTVARLSGDEFVILAEGLPDDKGIQRVANAVLESLREPFELDGQEVFATASVGVSLFPRDATDAEGLLRAADSAMYRAKHGGKNRYQHFSPEISAACLERFSVENHLRRALDRNEFSVYYQPQFEVKTGRLAGYEALLRWTHPKLGIVSPSRFIPIAEESGLIIGIGQWILRHACGQARAWQSPAALFRTISVNVSALQLSQPDFVQSVLFALEASGLDPCCLELEITESLLMRDVEDFARKMSALRSLGVRVSVDDFGTGYSSLSYLQRLPVDVLKLDRSFVDGLKKAGNGRALVQSVVSMAHELGLKVTAEGIETHQQLEAIHETGCDLAQGYLLGIPAPAGAVATEAYPVTGGAKYPIPIRRPGRALCL